MSTVRRRYDDGDRSDETAAKRPRGQVDADQYETEAKLKDLIARVGVKSENSSIESNLEGLCSLLEADLERYRTKVIDIVASCVEYMPEKITVYSTLVGLLNARNFNFGGEIVEKMVSELQEKLQEEKYNEALYITIFLCDLGNSKVLTIGSVADFLENLVQMAYEEGIPQVRSDWFMYAVLHSLPWIGSELAEHKADELKNIFEGCQRYLENRKKDYVGLLRVWLKDTPHEQEDYLDCLWAQVKRLKEADWKENHIQRHYLAFDSILQDALHHNLPNFTPSDHKETSTYPLPTIVFRMFDYADCSDITDVLPGTHSIERFLVEEEIRWILNQYSFNIKACAEELQLYVTNVNLPIFHMILEVVFGEMFRLPQNPQPIIYYGTLLFDLCRIFPNNIPAPLAQATEILFNRLSGMQPVCVDRFVDWFSYNLSNFRYRFSWNDWIESVEHRSPWNPQCIFVREVFEKIMRFSYHDRVCEVVPTEFSMFLPPKPEIQYALDDDTGPDGEFAKTIRNLFQDRASNDVIKTELKNAEGEYDPQLFGVFFAVLLKMASASFSHNFAALTKYFQTLKEVADVSEDMQSVLLRTLFSCWRYKSQMMIILVDKLLKMQVLDCGVVVAWIFSDEMKPETERQWLWEVLNTALDRLSRHIAKVDRDVETLRKEIEKKRSKDDDEVMEVDDAARKEEDDELVAQQDKLDSLRDFQKNLFLDVFHKFTIVLTEHIVNCEAEGAEIVTPWYDWMTGRFKQVFLMHNNELRRFSEDMGTELFTETTVDLHVLEPYIQFKALTM